MRTRWRESLAVDPRALAAFRISLGLLLLADLAGRAFDLRAHYTDFGILPRWADLEWIGPRGHLSVHALFGNPAWEIALFLLAAAAAICLLLGYRTRLASGLSWYLLLSLHVRNPAILSGADNLLRVLLVFSLFIPLGCCWSLDRPASGGAAAPGSILTAGTLAIQLQLCAVYWFTAAAKSGAAWHGAGTAIWIALSFDQIVSTWGRFLRHFPRLLGWATHFTLGLEWFGPLLVWSPIVTSGIRIVVVFLFVGFHLLGLGPAMYLGLFPWVCAAAWLLFLPAPFWDWLARETPRFAALGSRSLESLRRRVGQGGPSSVRPFGRAGEWIAVVFLVYGTLWSLQLVDDARLGSVGGVIGLEHSWNMFSPEPPTDDGWYVVVGKLADGRAADVWNGGPPSPGKPGSVAASMRNVHWAKYLEQLRDAGFVKHRRLFGNYLCREWNEDRRGSDRLEDITILYMLEETVPPDRELPARPLALWQQSCAAVPLHGERAAEPPPHPR